MSRTPIIVINLDRRPDRLSHVTTEFQRLGLGFERLAAVDATQLDDRIISAAYDSRANRSLYFAPLNRAEIACWLSHRKAWELVARSDRPFCLVCEDDAELSDPLPAALDALIARPVDWDVVKLHSFETHVAAHIRALSFQLDLVRHVTVSLGTIAYCISRQGARKLLASSLPIKRPLDVELQHWWDHGIEVLAIEPPVVRPAPHFESSITARLGVTQRLAREVRRPLFRARLNLRSRRELRRAGLVRTARIRTSG